MLDEHQHPRGHAGQVGHVRADGFPGDGLHLWLEVAHQGRLLAGHADMVDNGGNVLYEDGGEVAHQAVVGAQVGGMAAAQYQSFAGEETALRVLSQVDGHGVLPAPVVRVLQRFPADGYELALVVGGARRLGEPPDFRWPNQVLLSLAQAGHVGLHFLVGLYGESSAELVIRAQVGEVVYPAPFRACRQAE